MITIRQTEDLDLITELNKTCFYGKVPIEPDDLDESTWWVAYAGGEPAGFGGSRPKPGKVFMTRAGVLQQYRGAGLQQRLIRARVAHARREGAKYIYTYVWSLNIASMRSLVKCGFLPYYGERAQSVGSSDYATFVYLKKMLTATPKSLTKAA